MADAMGIDTFPIVAHSGGAAYALVCAWKLPHRVSSVGLSSAVAPRSMVTRDRSIPLRTKIAVWSVANAPGFLLRFVSSRFARGMRHRPEKTTRAFLRRLPAGERAIVGGAVESGLLRDCAISASKQGAAPIVEDLRLIMDRWGFPLQEVHQPVTLWHGEDDTTATPQTAQLLASNLPAARMRLFANSGHLTAWLCHAQETLACV
jgi:pimeloyl-ACP methyl ester carboxylesterase